MADTNKNNQDLEYNDDNGGLDIDAQETSVYTMGELMRERIYLNRNLSDVKIQERVFDERSIHRHKLLDTLPYHDEFEESSRRIENNKRFKTDLDEQVREK